MIIGLIVLFALSSVVSIVQSYIMRQQKKIIDAITFVLQEQEERNEVLLLFSVKTILTNAIEEENYEMAEKCRKIIGKLTSKENGNI